MEAKYLTLLFGGEGGIRTHGTLLTHANFQDWCHKPTRPPLHIEDKCPATVFILAFLKTFVNSNFPFIFLFLLYYSLILYIPLFSIAFCIASCSSSEIVYVDFPFSTGFAYILDISLE